VTRSQSTRCSFEDRLADHARRLREEANVLPPGKERNEMMRKVRQTSVSAHVNEWPSSPGSQPPG
jgi:hypothetical protein